jgi:hypothetical protein
MVIRLLDETLREPGNAISTTLDSIMTDYYVTKLAQ